MALLVCLVAGTLLSAPPAGAQIAPKFTVDGMIVFATQEGAAGTVDYSIRGHEYGNTANWQWWSIETGGAADTATRTRTLGDWSGTLGGAAFAPAPDVAIARGGIALAVWEDQEDGDRTCFDTLSIPKGHIEFAKLDARNLPDALPTLSASADAATGPDYTIYLNPSVALDSTGRGILIWREISFSHDADGCVTDSTTRTRFKTWNGAGWDGDADGDPVPGSEKSGLPIGTSSFFNIGYATDVSFTSVRIDTPVTGAAPKTRERAVAVWNDFAGTDSEACPGAPSPTTVHEQWPRYAVWNGSTFGMATNIEPSAATTSGPPFYLPTFLTEDRIGIAGDRSTGADVVFHTARLETLCDSASPTDEVWTARWNPASSNFANASKLADGEAPDVTQEPDDVAVAVYDGVKTKSETSPGVWSAESTVASATDPGAATVASLPHDRTLAAWIDGGSLRWAENSGSGWGAAAQLVADAINPELGARPVARWAFLVYGAAQNSLEGFMPGDLDEMEKVGSSADLAVVVQVDDATGVVGTDGSFRAQIIEHPAAGVGSASAPNEVNIAEPNMGLAATLSGFLTWAKEQYPADDHALVIWNHGDQWKGIAEDSGPGDWLDMSELSTGLAAAPLPLRVLAFDACLMGTLEVARQIWINADVLVASQDCIPGTGFPYGNGTAGMLNALESNIGWTGAQLGSDMVDRYEAFYTAQGTTSFTLSAIRLNADLLDLVTAVNSLANGLRTGLDDANTRGDPADNVQMGVKAARDATHETTITCCRGNVPTDDSIDLVDFTRKVNAQASVDAAYKSAIPTIQAELAAVVINEAHGSAHNGGATPGANGLSIFFPQSQTATNPPAIEDAFDEGSTVGTLYAANPDPLAPAAHPMAAQAGFTFPSVTQWDEFLYRFYSPLADAGPDVSALVGESAIVSASGTSDGDGNVPVVDWDFDPTVDSDALDSDKDGVDEADDDVDAMGTSVLFPCDAEGVFPVRLVVRDDHEELTGHESHFNVSADNVLVTCSTGAGDTTPPTPTITTPSTIFHSIVATFDETVQNVTLANFVLRVTGTATNLAATLTCQDAGGVVVSCATGAVRKAILRPKSSLVPGQFYTAIVNPSGAAPVTDLAGNPAALTEAAFRAATSHQETSPAAIFAWKHVTTSAALGGSAKMHRKAGPRASFSFTGTNVTWYTAVGRDQGWAEVKIDGVSRGTFNQFATTRAYGVTRMFSGLPSGSHRIEIFVLGLKGDPAATGTFVTVDAFKVGGTLFATPVAGYFWQSVNSNGASAGKYVRSELPGTSVKFTFRGTEVKWRTLKSSTQGMAEVFIDNVSVAVVDNYSATSSFASRTFGGLTDAVHTLRIVVLQQRNPSTSAGWVSVDRFDVA